MSEKIEYVKDGNGKIIGQIRGDWILNSKSEQVARFDREIDRTRRADASIIGFGDQRLKALNEERHKEQSSSDRRRGHPDG